MFSGQDAQKEKKGAKQVVTAKAGTERRQRQLMSVRHKAHNDVMKHLRTEEEDDGYDNAATSAEAAKRTVWDFTHMSSPATVPISLFPEITKMMLTGTTSKEVYQGTMLIRKLLAVTSNPPYDMVAQPHIVQRLVELTTQQDLPDLQFEAAWALTNLATGTTAHTMIVIESGAVPPLIQLMQSPDMRCRDQACWALSNLAGENVTCRDIVLNAGALPILLSLLSTPEAPVYILRNATWAVSNLLRGRPPPDLTITIDAVPVLAALLSYHDEQVVTESLWGLSYISDGTAARVQALLDAGVVPRVVELLRNQSATIRMPAIRTVGNIAAGSDEQTQTVINAGALQCIPELLKLKRAIRREACWTLSNIAAGRPFQIDALISSGVLVPLLECIRQPELDVKKEAVWTVANVSFCGTPDHVKYLISAGFVGELCEVLSLNDSKILIVCLEALQVFLHFAEEEHKAGQCEVNYVAEQMMHNGAVQHLEQLQTHAHAKVYNLATSIIRSHFSDGTEQEAWGGDNEQNMQDLFDSHYPHGGGMDGGYAPNGTIQL